MKVMGFDEAGRGCVLGDLCIGAFVIEDPDDDALREAGAADSKRLSKKKRELAREKLAALGLGIVVQITPKEIDQGNLNALEEAAIAALIREHRPDRVLIDALGHPKTLPAVLTRLKEMVGEPLPEWLMEPKADATYPVVGAASIFAKTTRDAALAAHDASCGPLGSGYPSDPVTKAWLRAHSQRGEPWPSFVRTRWATIRNLAQQNLL